MKISVNREDRFIYNVVGTLQGHVEPGLYYAHGAY